MRDLWSQPRIGPHLQSLAYRFEKAGLTLDLQPIPWNAEAVLVEAVLLKPRHFEAHANDFSLTRVGCSQSFAPVEFNGRGGLRMTFRLPVPTQRTTVELTWNSRSLGQMTMPVLPQVAFCRQLGLEMPTLAVRLGADVVPCQTYVSSQCQELLATALLTCETSLVPLVDLDLHVEFQSERDGEVRVVPVRLTRSQLAAQRALITVGLPRPSRVGAWSASWKLGDTVLASQHLRAITRPHFNRALRLLDARFVVEDKQGRVQLTRHPPLLAEAARVGPCFVIKSAEPGMAGIAALQIRAQVEGSVQSPLLLDQEMLITDGPTPFAPGTFAAADLEQVTGFELRVGAKVLGVRPMAPAPTAVFNAEGGFKPPENFSWSEAAEEELSQRLNRLLQG